MGARPLAAFPRPLSRTRRAPLRARRRSARGPHDRPAGRRVSKGGIDEVVLAMNATLEGQTTAHYVAERLEGFPDPRHPIRAWTSVGGELDYLDEGTLAQALRARRPVA